MAAPRRGLFLALGAVILLQLALRGWALSRQWFYADDFFLILAGSSPYALGELLEPYFGHLMPGARLLAWALAQAGGLSWLLAAAMILALQLVASAAAARMLVTLFGLRWGILAPLALYLSTPLTMPSTTWWTAAITQLPTQAMWFLVIDRWVRHLRSGESRHLKGALAFLVVGLACDVRAILVVPVLAVLAVGWFADGTVRQRGAALVRQRWAWLWLGVVSGGYAAAYLVLVSSPVSRLAGTDVLDTARVMLGEALPAALLGGPWTWQPQPVWADPPTWAGPAGWLAFGVLVVVLWLRRRRTLRAWLPLGYLTLALLVLISITRTSVMGEGTGAEIRVYGEVACMWALGLGLASMHVAGAPGSSVARERPRIPRVPAPVLVALVVVVVGSSSLSAARFAVAFAATNESAAWFAHARSDLDAVEHDVDLVDHGMPAQVIDLWLAPYNTTSHLVPLISDRARFPLDSADPAMFTEAGRLARVGLTGGVVSTPGPRPCGWPVSSTGVTVPMYGATFDLSWWIRIRYDALADSVVTVSAGETEVVTAISAGSRELYVAANGVFDAVTLTPQSGGADICVRDIEVGLPTPGPLLVPGAGADGG